MMGSHPELNSRVLSLKSHPFLFLFLTKELTMFFISTSPTMKNVATLVCPQPYLTYHIYRVEYNSLYF